MRNCACVTVIFDKRGQRGGRMKRLQLCDDGMVLQVTPIAAANGCGIEIQAFYDPALLQKEPDAIEIHKKAIEKIGARSLHGPFTDLCPGSMDNMVRELARNRYDIAVNMATTLGAVDIVLHHGYVPGTSYPTGWLSRSTTFWQKFLDELPETINIHIENLLEHDPGLISEVVGAVKRKNFDICLDIGHAHCNSKKSVLHWIEKLKNQIGYVHLHDNHGQTDEHLGLGSGTIPMQEVCRALNEYAPGAIWSIEAQPKYIEKSLKWLKENGFLS
jgi:sugar phosphate isomerase/epimerase